MTLEGSYLSLYLRVSDVLDKDAFSFKDIRCDTKSSKASTTYQDTVFFLLFLSHLLLSGVPHQLCFQFWCPISL